MLNIGKSERREKSRSRRRSVLPHQSSSSRQAPAVRFPLFDGVLIVVPPSFDASRSLYKSLDEYGAGKMDMQLNQDTQIEKGEANTEAYGKHDPIRALPKKLGIRKAVPSCADRPLAGPSGEASPPRAPSPPDMPKTALKNPVASPAPSSSGDEFVPQSSPSPKGRRTRGGATLNWTSSPRLTRNRKTQRPSSIFSSGDSSGSVVGFRNGLPGVESSKSPPRMSSYTPRTLSTITPAQLIRNYSLAWHRPGHPATGANCHGTNCFGGWTMSGSSFRI